MELIDIHTHDTGRENAILNCSTHIAGRRISIGIHPWNITNDWEKQFKDIERMALECNVAAIGECGIDKLKSPAPIETQRIIFRKHAELAEELHKPLIIHCVKGFDEIIALHKEMAPAQAWTIHGFRGKSQQAIQLTKAGFNLSFGEKFNHDSVKATPMERMFVESDESRMPIHEIYAAIATAKGVPIEELAATIQKNAIIFGQF